MRNWIVLSALLSGVALAAEVPPPPAMEPVPDDAPVAEQAPESVEPQVTIIQREKETVEEYRIHNQLYMIKVTPKVGKEYYLVDSDGDGSLDSRRNELDPKILVPAWVIFKW
jgi:Protein of unknown function (DUF2782)